MKLLTHNFLSSKFLKGAKAGYPLKLAATSVEQVTCDYDEGMLASTLKKIDYDVLKAAATSIGEGRDLPDQLPQTFSKYSQELKNELHRVLFAVDVKVGELECPDTGRKFPIKVTTSRVRILGSKPKYDIVEALQLLHQPNSAHS